MKDIIIVDDEHDIRTIISTILEDEGYQTRIAANSEELFTHLKGRIPQVILLDIWLKKSTLDGIEILHKLAQYFPMVDVIMISGHGNIQTAVHAMRIGAHSFMEKPIKTDYLLLTLERLFEMRRMKFLSASPFSKARIPERKKTKDSEKEKCLLPVFLHGNSSLTSQLKSTLSKSALKESRVILTGSVGVGKYSAAQYIHAHSSRQNGRFIFVPFYKQIDSIILEKTLFGYSNPEFPDYIGFQGALEQAHMGTIYLEKIDLYPHAIQKKLIKFLVDKKFSRFMASDKIVTSDARVIVSLSASTDICLHSGNLLNDLYVRLAIETINVPDIKQRQDDIIPIISAYLQKLSDTYHVACPKLSENIIPFLENHNWKYNLLDLKALCDYLVIHHHHCQKTHPIELKDLPHNLSQDTSNIHQLPHVIHKSLREAREAFERDYLIAQLNRFKGNISKTAQFVGMERSALHRKLRSLEIENCRDENPMPSEDSHIEVT